MISPSAQKAAVVFAWYRQITTVTPVYPSYEFSDKICAPDDGWKPLYTQQAITEAVDAAVAQERERYRTLAQEWNRLAFTVPNGPLDKGRVACASELLALDEDK